MPDFGEVKKEVENATIKTINKRGFSKEDIEILEDKYKELPSWGHDGSSSWRNELLEGKVSYGTKIFANQVDCWHGEAELELAKQNKAKGFWSFAKMAFKGITGCNVPSSWYQSMDTAIRKYGKFLEEQLAETDVSKRITKKRFDELKDEVEKMIACYIEHIYYTKYAPVLLWYIHEKGVDDPGDALKETKLFLGSLYYHGTTESTGSWISDIKKLSCNFK